MVRLASLQWLLALALALCLVRTTAQTEASAFCGLDVGERPDPDLPGVGSNYREIPAGSLVLAMDSVYQSRGNGYGSWFNEKAYGLAWYILNGKIPMEWIISANKTSLTDVDLSVRCQRIEPDLGTVESCNFRSGPMVIRPMFKDFAVTIIQDFNTLHSSYKVDIYETLDPAMADVRYELDFVPKIGILEDGDDHRDVRIHHSALEWAGFPDTEAMNTIAYSTVTSSMCYTMLTEPHYTSPSAGDLTAVHGFLSSGGTIFSQCAGVESYEAGLSLHTTAGINVSGDSGGTSNIPHVPLAISQMDNLPDTSEGGDVGRYKPKSGSDWGNNTFTVVGIDSDVQVLATASKLERGVLGGLSVFMGGHTYMEMTPGVVKEGFIKATTELRTNARRVLFNTVFIPNQRPPSCGTAFKYPMFLTAMDPTTHIVVDSEVVQGFRLTNNGTRSGPAAVNFTIPIGIDFVSATVASGSCSYDTETRNGSCVATGTIAPCGNTTFTLTTIPRFLNITERIVVSVPSYINSMMGSVRGYRVTEPQYQLVPSTGCISPNTTQSVKATLVFGPIYTDLVVNSSCLINGHQVHTAWQRELTVSDEWTYSLTYEPSVGDGDWAAGALNISCPIWTSGGHAAYVVTAFNDGNTVVGDTTPDALGLMDCSVPNATEAVCVDESFPGPNVTFTLIANVTTVDVEYARSGIVTNPVHGTVVSFTATIRPEPGSSPFSQLNITSPSSPTSTDIVVIPDSIVATHGASFARGNETGDTSIEVQFPPNVTSAVSVSWLGYVSTSVAVGSNITVIANYTLANVSTCTGASNTMQGSDGVTLYVNIPGPRITSAVANDPDDGDVVLSSGDTLQISFDTATNVVNVADAAALNALFTFRVNGVPRSLTGYSGVWNDDSTLTITITDATGVPMTTISNLVIEVNAAAGLKAKGNLSLASLHVFSSVTGDWGLPPGPAITRFEAYDPDNLDKVYGDGDGLIIEFDQPTTQPDISTKATFNQVFFVSQGGNAVYLGKNYTGRWTSPTRAQVSIVDVTSASPIPQVGVMTISTNGAKLPLVGTKTSEVITTERIVTGSWGSPIGPSLERVYFTDPDEGDSVFSDGDTLVLTFDKETNTPRVVSKKDVDNLLKFSRDMGEDYTGAWSADKRTLIITFVNTTGAVLDQVGSVRVTVSAGANLNDAADSLSPSTSSAVATGNFGHPFGPAILRVVCDDPDDLDAIFSTGDTVTIVFSEATNTPPASSQSDIDEWIKITPSLGSAYSGQWIGTRNDTLMITVVNATRASDARKTPAPFWTTGDDRIGVEIMAGTDPKFHLRNIGETSRVSTAVAPVAVGDWGLLAGPRVYQALFADKNHDQRFNNGDQIVLTFSMPTNQPDVASKLAIDQLFSWMRPVLDVNTSFAESFGFEPLQAQPPASSSNTTQEMGRNYTGVWTTPDTLVMTFHDVGEMERAPQPGNLIANISGKIRNAAKTSLPVSTCNRVDLLGPKLLRAVASNGPESVNVLGYARGDLITMTFDVATSQNDLSTKARVDVLFSFSQPIGLDYSGTWSDPRTCVVTLVTPVPGTGPDLETLVVSTNERAKLQDIYFLSLGSSGDTSVAGSWSTSFGSSITTDGDGLGLDDSPRCKTFWCHWWWILLFALVSGILGCVSLFKFYSAYREESAHRASKDTTTDNDKPGLSRWSDNSAHCIVPMPEIPEDGAVTDLSHMSYGTASAAPHMHGKGRTGRKRSLPKAMSLARGLLGRKISSELLPDPGATETVPAPPSPLLKAKPSPRNPPSLPQLAKRRTSVSKAVPNSAPPSVPSRSLGTAAKALVKMKQLYRDSIDMRAVRKKKAMPIMPAQKPRQRTGSLLARPIGAQDSPAHLLGMAASANTSTASSVTGTVLLQANGTGAAPTPLIVPTQSHQAVPRRGGAAGARPPKKMIKPSRPAPQGPPQ